MTRGLAIAAVLAAACSDRTPKAPPAAVSPPGNKLVGGKTRQLVTALVDDWASTHATMRVWTRTALDWAPASAPWPAVIGKSGAAWGRGLHGAGAPGREGPIKKEGDGKSPAGAFAIRAAYGTAAEPPRGAKLPYESTAAGDFECIDDPASDHYATIVDRKQVPSDWASSEHMLRDDALYTWVVDVAHNPERTPGKGSCIFLHVWGGPESATLGCTAMDAGQLVALLATLDPEAHPVFVLLPKTDYAALAAPWDLPPL